MGVPRGLFVFGGGVLSVWVWVTVWWRGGKELGVCHVMEINPKIAFSEIALDGLRETCRMDRMEWTWKLHPKPWDVHTCPLGAPEWVIDLLKKDSDRPYKESREDSRMRCARLDRHIARANGHANGHPPDHTQGSSDRDGGTDVHIVPEVFAKSPPNYTTKALDIKEVSIDAIDSKLFLRHVYTSLPIKISLLRRKSGPFSENYPAFQRLKKGLSDVLSKERLPKGEYYSKICTSAECSSKGRMTSSIRDALLSNILSFPPPAPRTHFVGPAVFWGDTGQRFGGPLHFDQLCQAQISIQFQGKKRWNLWSPSGWEVPPLEPGGKWIPPHSRFETVLREGDILFFAPGWFHSTHILKGLSIAGTYQFNFPPVGMSLKKGYYKASPFGYEQCGQNRLKGWETSYEIWSRIVEHFGLDIDLDQAQNSTIAKSSKASTGSNTASNQPSMLKDDL